MATSAFSFSYKLLIVLCMISLLIAAPNHHLAEAAVTCNEDSMKIQQKSKIIQYLNNP
ncbi:hypothetical protein QQ045_024544 [Rhodiola kirilowii]